MRTFLKSSGQNGMVGRERSVAYRGDRAANGEHLQVGIGCRSPLD